jgi:hypothetical protein
VFELSRPFDATEGWWAIGGCGAANWVSDNVFYLHYVFIAYNDQGSQAIVSARRQTTAIATQKITHRTILLSPHLGAKGIRIVFSTMFLCVVIAAAVEWECNSGDLLTIEFGGDGITVPDNCIADIGVSTMEGSELRRVGECL